MIHGIILADMHWGAINPTRFYQELEECLFHKIKGLTQLDFIAIAGDLFDTKEYLTSDVVLYVSKFLGTILNQTEHLNTMIYIMEGTRTHDNNQPEALFQIIENVCEKFYRVQVIDTVKEITYHGCELLFIPEEYIMDMEEYYKDFLYQTDKRYDFIIGHGSIDKIWFAKANQHSSRISAPVFEVERLLSVGRHVYFGHIHDHKRYGKNKQFQYVGPTTRWEFGKEDDCGYIYLEYNPETKQIREEFVINELAPILTTRILNVKESIPLSEISDKIDRILSEEMTQAERVRLIVNINSKLDRYNEIRDFIIHKVGQYQFVKLLLSVDIDEDSMDSMKESMEEKCVKRNYLFDRNLDIERQIQEFIKNRSGKIITIENIRKYLNSIEGGN